MDFIGADERTWTFTPLRVHGPEPCASANSATSARLYYRQETLSFQTANPESTVRPSHGAWLYDVDAHAARRAAHRAHRRFQLEAVQVGHLDLGDLFDLSLGDLADLRLVRFRRALRQIARALDQHRHRRRLGDERERTIRENRDHHGDDQAFLVLARRLGIERLAKIHDVHALRSERRTYRRSRRRLARRNLQLDLRCNLLRHTLTFFHLQEFQFHRRRASEYRHHHAQGATLGIDLVHFSREIRERAVHDPHRIVFLERHLRPRPLRARRLAVQNRIHFFGTQRHRGRSPAHKARDARRVLYFVPQRVVHFHFHQHVAGIDQTLAGDLFAVTQLHHFFGRNQNLSDLIGKSEGVGAGAQRFLHLVLESRIGVDDVPVLGRCWRCDFFRGRFDILRGRFHGLVHFVLPGGILGVLAGFGHPFLFRLFFEILLVGHIPPIL